MQQTQRLNFKTLWLSDIHLGSRWSAAINHTNRLLQFVKADTLYLVGDVIDGRDLARVPYWPHAHEEALQRLMHAPHDNSHVVMLAGNHDIGLRRTLVEAGVAIGDVQRHLPLGKNGQVDPRLDRPAVHLQQRALFYNHEGAHIVMHGDEGEVFSPHASRLLPVYDFFYYGLSLISPTYNRLAAPLAGKYTPLTRAFQNLVCTKLDFVTSFEQRVAKQAAELGMRGVFAGHVHYPADKMIDGVHYRNSGSLQADVTCLAETFDGRIQLLDWGSISRKLTGSLPHDASVLDAAAATFGAKRLTTPTSFVYQPTATSRHARLVPSTCAHLIASATYGPGPRRYPVPLVG